MLCEDFHFPCFYFDPSVIHIPEPAPMRHWGRILPVAIKSYRLGHRISAKNGKGQNHWQAIVLQTVSGVNHSMYPCIHGLPNRSTDSVTYSISKHLTSILAPLVSNTQIINSQEFANKVTEITLHLEDTMFSIDVTSILHAFSLKKQLRWWRNADISMAVPLASPIVAILYMEEVESRTSITL